MFPHGYEQDIMLIVMFVSQPGLFMVWEEQLDNIFMSKHLVELDFQDSTQDYSLFMKWWCFYGYGYFCKWFSRWWLRLLCIRYLLLKILENILFYQSATLYPYQTFFLSGSAANMYIPSNNPEHSFCRNFIHSFHQWITLDIFSVSLQP